MDWLIQNLSAYGNREAIVSGGVASTYADLLDLYREWQRLLKERGVAGGEVVLLEGDYGAEACAALLALIANGNVLVPLSRGAPSAYVQTAIDIAQPNRTIAIAGDGRRIGEFVTRRHGELLRRQIASGSAGLILFTSGSTGVPKAILHDMQPFLAKYRLPREALRTMSFLQFDHIGGLNTLLHTLANGGTVVAPAGRAPSDVCAAIERCKVELLPATPSFLNLLLMTESFRSYDVSSLRVITYGTEAMPDITLSRLRLCLPGVQLRQTYGLSEIGVLRAKSRASGSPWLTIGGEGVETRIVDGTLRIRSRSAMRGYLNAPSPFDEEGWLDTQDEVAEDGEYIRIVGRKSDIINVGGRKVYPIEVENALLQMPDIADATVKGEAHFLLGHIVTAVVEVKRPMDAATLKRRIREFCRDRLEPYQFPVKVTVADRPLTTERFKKNRK